MIAQVRVKRTETRVDLLHRAGGDAFDVAGSPLGGMTVAVVDDLL